MLVTQSISDKWKWDTNKIFRFIFFLSTRY